MILSFLVVSSVLVVSFGRLGDMFGRVKMYNLGFAIYTVTSLILTVDWLHGQPGALYLVVGRVFQGVGAAFLVANSSAILTDAFPEDQRGLALGINNVAAISGVFIGLVLGGILGPIEWRLVFLVSVPFGLAGTLWAYYKLRETPKRAAASIDWPGNITFAIGLIAIMVGITYGIQPYGGSTMGWTSPTVLSELAVGAAFLGAFGVIERRSAQPMFRLALFRIRAFTAGVLSSFLAAVARGGLMFMMIIWLQGIWLPEHGFSFAQTPLWAGIYMLPLTAGFLIAGPISGALSDRFGSRPFATGGMLLAGFTFLLLEQLPINFAYWQFALLLLLNGLAMGAFASPNRAGVMNSLPPQDRGAGSGMNATFQNSAQVLSIGIFFTLVIIGLSGTLASSLSHGLIAEGISRPVADKVGNLPPVSTLFAAFLGYNPLAHLLPAQRPGQLAARRAGRGHWPLVLPSPDCRAVRLRPTRRVRFRRPGLLRGRRSLVVPGQALRLSSGLAAASAGAGAGAGAGISLALRSPDVPVVERGGASTTTVGTTTVPTTTVSMTTIVRDLTPADLGRIVCLEGILFAPSRAFTAARVRTGSVGVYTQNAEPPLGLPRSRARLPRFDHLVPAQGVYCRPVSAAAP